VASTEYSYSVAGDTLNGLVDEERLTEEIQASAIVTALDYIATSGDDLSVWMKDALSGGDETILDGLVAAHTGEPLVGAGEVITTVETSGDGTPIFADRPLRLGRESLKESGDGSESMNVDGRPSGTPVTVWNGTGASDTGGDWTASDTGSEQAAADAGSGTNGWDTGVTALNGFTTFDNGSLVDVAGTYDTLQLQLNPQAFPTGARLQVGFLDASNALVGNLLRIEQYASNMDLDVWQQVSLPVEDFNLDADVQKLRFRYAVEAGQRHYLDDITLIPAGGDGPYRFGIRAPVGERYHLSMLVLQVTAPETGWNNDAFANIAGGLTNGLLLRHRRLSDSTTLWRFNTKDNREMFGQYHPQESFAFADGTLLLGFMVKPGKASVIVTDDDVLEFIVRDDLSSITDMRAYMHYGVEEVV